MSTPAAVRQSPAVEAFLSQEQVPLYIGGQWVRSTDQKTFRTLDPGSGAVLAEVSSATAEDVNLAVNSARKAFRESGWARMSPNERGVYLHRLADLVDDRRQILAEIESLDVGKPLPQASYDVANFVQTMRYYADLAIHIHYREPIAVSRHEARIVRHAWGACAFILPWNFPLLLAGWNLSPALAAGNTVIVKPAEDTPLSTLYLARLAEEAGIPDGVINVVAGLGETAGSALARHPGISRMGFTGSPEVGRMIAESCGRNLVPVKLELGGKGAAVVLDDANVESTAAALAGAVTLNSGQVCCTATRWLVHEDVYNKFVECAVDQMKKVRIGYGRDSETQMGPVVSRKQLDRVLGYLHKGSEQGALTLLEGGEAIVVGHEHGFYAKPALMAGPPENIAARDEIFGPVAYVLKFRDDREAVELVNSSPYGLANSVWSKDLTRANTIAESLVAGNSWINAHNVFVHGVPYAGVNLSGMGGGVLGPRTLFDYLREQSIVRPL